MNEKNADKAVAAVSRLSDQAVLKEAAYHSHFSEARRAAVGKITEQDTLAEIAVRDDDLHVRLAAIKGITNKSLLTKIVEQLGKYDESAIVAAQLRIDESAIVAAQLRIGDEEALLSVICRFIRDGRDEHARLNQALNLINVLPGGCSPETLRQIIDSWRYDKRDKYLYRIGPMVTSEFLSTYFQETTDLYQLKGLAGYVKDTVVIEARKSLTNRQKVASIYRFFKILAGDVKSRPD